MNDNHDEVEVAIRTGVQAGDDGGYLGSGGRQIVGSGA
jgi:hypothetical protein